MKKGIALSVWLVLANASHAEPWEEVIPKVAERAAFFLAEADRRGYADIAARSDENAWYAYYRDSHECAILGRMLGVPDLIAEDEKIDVPQLADSMPDQQIIQLYGVGRTYEAWVEQALFFNDVSLERKVTAWNETCALNGRIPFAPEFIIPTGPGFADVPAASLPPGFPPVQPDLADWNDWMRDRFQSIVEDGVKAGPNFAGHYSLVALSCGTSCRFYHLSDLRTGKVIDMPFGGEASPEILVDFVADSRLIYTKQVGKDSTECVLQAWVFDGTGFGMQSEDTLPRDGTCNDWNFRVITE